MAMLDPEAKRTQIETFVKYAFILAITIVVLYFIAVYLLPLVRR